MSSLGSLRKRERLSDLFSLWPLCTHHEVLHLHNKDGELLTSQQLPNKIFNSYSYNGHRGELHESLFRYAQALGIEIRLGQDVSEYWEDAESGEAGVVTNGERLAADMVVGADGVRSKARTLVLVSVLCVAQSRVETDGLHRDTRTNRNLLDMRSIEPGLTATSRASTKTLLQISCARTVMLSSAGLVSCREGKIHKKEKG